MNKFTKIISVMLAVVLVVMAIPFTTFAATKGDVDGNGEISAVDARLILQVVAGLKTEAELKNAAGADVDGKSGITAVDARIVLQIVAGLADVPSEPETPEQPETPSGDSEKAQMAALFNAKTAEIAKGDYKWSRTCGYIQPLTATDVDVSMIQATVDKFLGIGTTVGTKADAGKYALIAMNLTADDIENIYTDNEQVRLTLKDASNPTVGGNASLNHVTNDIITEADAANEIKAVVSSATLKEFNATYYDIRVIAKIDDNQEPTSVTISYKLKATFAIMSAGGEGTVETKLKYTDLKY